VIGQHNARDQIYIKLTIFNSNCLWFRWLFHIFV